MRKFNLVCLMVFLNLSISALANLPSWPAWTSASPFIKLDFDLSINGKKINALAFKWPSQSGINSGDVEFGYVGSQKTWRGIDTKGRYTSIGEHLLIVNTDNGREFHFNRLGEISEKKANGKLKFLGELIPIHKTETIGLQVNKSQSVLKSYGDLYGIANSEYIYLTKPLILADGVTASVLRFTGHGVSIHFGNINSKGIWEKTNFYPNIKGWTVSKDYSKKFVVKLTFRIDGVYSTRPYTNKKTNEGLNGEFVITSENELHTPSGEIIKVTALSSKVVQYTYTASERYGSSCRSLFKR